MPLPGGAADKFGNRYEQMWTIEQLIRLLQGNVDSVRIEDPNIDKAEFVIHSSGVKELHQAKRSHPDGKWSIASLSAEKIPQTIFPILAGNRDRFVFVSASDAPELRELSERARQAASYEEYEGVFLRNKELKANFDKLAKYTSGPESAYDILTRIEVRMLDEFSIRESIKWQLSALFLDDPGKVRKELSDIVLDSVHMELTREMLVNGLEKNGYKLRRIRFDSAGLVIKQVTDRYLEGVRKKLIRRSLRPRDATHRIVERLETGGRTSEIVITGKAGVGKSACVLETVEYLRGKGIPVLAFRLDRVEPVSTPTELGVSLGLEESPALVLAAASAAGGEAALVLDQLDAVGTISGQSETLFEAVEGLIDEVRGLGGRVKIHLIISCRSFDWENDASLRRLLIDKKAMVEVSDFSADEVREILKLEGYDAEKMQPGQMRLLCLPQNLSMFLDIEFDRATSPSFANTKELFDRYWDAKRRAVNSRISGGDRWSDIVNALTGEMTAQQQLFVTREKLDGFSPEYLTLMSSEGVLTFDGLKYGFGHESFFDYCYARAFMAGTKSLVDVLKASEQHLFRRSQVRQVFAYLRDADRERYLKELRRLLSDPGIRAHIKDLAVAVLVGTPDPTDEEWAIVEPWINEFTTLTAAGKEPSKFSKMVADHFFTSSPWFHMADRSGLIEKWLNLDSPYMVNLGVNYLRYHQKQYGDRVAELLEPFVGMSGDWPDRLRHIMAWSDFGNSRRFFELFLRLIDDGTLDNARGAVASNSTFWSMIYGLKESRPEWISEILNHWLRRRMAILSGMQDEENGMKWFDLFNHDEFGAQLFHESAEKAPDAFVDNVLSVVLEISDAAVYQKDANTPKRDAVWSLIFAGDHERAQTACLTSLASALERMAEERPHKLKEAISELRRRDTHTSNFLLLKMYTKGASSFADEAASLLCSEPWRLRCGYNDSAYWVAMELIRAIVPLCSEVNRNSLESTILGYKSRYERTAAGHGSAGHAQFQLLSAIPTEFQSEKARARYNELQRLGFAVPEPHRIQVGSVVSPIKSEAAEKMTDKQWLKAIDKYRTDNHAREFGSFKGGAYELSKTLKSCVEKEPERFALLCLQFPADTNPAYIRQMIGGLEDAKISLDLKLDVCRKAFQEDKTEFGGAIADLLANIDEPLPDDIIGMLDWLATAHPDPKKDAAGPFGPGNIYENGINTTRGQAALAIGELILKDESYVSRFEKTLDRMVADESLSVRSCVAYALLAVSNYDKRRAISLFNALVLGMDESLLATSYSERFIHRMLVEFFKEMRPCVESLLRSENEKASEAGSRLACIALLNFNYIPESGRNVAAIESAENLVDEAVSGSPSQRGGVAVVASKNVASKECREWCAERLLTLFNDTDESVRNEAASCFYQLENEPLSEYENLIGAFCESQAFLENSYSLIHLLESSHERLPGITCAVCEKFLGRIGDKAGDISSPHFMDGHTVAKLIFRTYQQNQKSAEWVIRCLDLIDEMCLERIREVRSGLDEYER